MCNIEIKHETVLLGMKREAQQVNDRIWLKREKAKMIMNQMEAKYLASVAPNDTKSKICTQEAEEKAEVAAKRRKASWFG